MRYDMTKRGGRPVTMFDLLNKPFALDHFFDDEPYGLGMEGFKVDIKDEKDHYSLKADLPGVRKEDLKVEFEDGTLTVSARHHTENETKDEQGYVVRERRSGSYLRTFRFDDAKADGITARYNDGVLTVEVRKEAPHESKTTIAIS